MLGCFMLCFFTCWIFVIFRDHLPTPPTRWLEPVFCVQQKHQSNATGGSDGMVGPGPWQEIHTISHHTSLGDWCDWNMPNLLPFLVSKFQEENFLQLKSSEPVCFGSIDVFEVIWNQIMWDTWPLAFTAIFAETQGIKYIFCQKAFCVKVDRF